MKKIVILLFFILLCNVFPLYALIGNPVLVAKFSYGTKFNQVAGDNEDKFHITDGFPPAFTLDINDNIYIADSGNYRVLFYNSNSKKTNFLFKYPKNLVINDIALLKNGSIVLSSLKSVFIYNRSGKLLREIEGVYPRDIYTVKNDILVYNSSSNIVMKFSSEGVISKFTEAIGYFPVSFDGNSIIGVKIDKKSYYLFNMNFDGTNDMFYSEELTDNEYICNVKPSGFDIMGNLYYEVLYGHDIDKKHEKHKYRLKLYEINIRSGKIIKEMETSPFRNRRVMVAPRQYVTSKKGEIFTYELTDSSYEIYKYK